MVEILRFNWMFKKYIKDSKLKMPVDLEHYDPDEFPHFHVFILTHKARQVETDLLNTNADLIASIPEHKIREVTNGDLLALGVILSDK